MDRNQIIRNSSFLLLIILLFTACESKHYYQETKDIKGNWGSKNPVEYTFNVKDSTINKLNLGFVLRNNTDYEYSNIYLFTKFIDPKGNEMIDTLQYYIANPDGTWIGKGMNTKEMVLVFRENLPVKDTGTYKLKVWHGMRTAKLKGIEDISLIADQAAD